jgi:predicted RNA binding protein YcfA (HicA-like mRNA interferase family)
VTKVPSLSYVMVVKALQRDGWTVVRQKGSHIRLQKRIGNELLKITVPAHNPIKRSTLAHILKQATTNLEHFNKLL